MHEDNTINYREITKADLPAVLRLYEQPEFDDGKVLMLDEAERIFERMVSYPCYKIHVAAHNDCIIGTFALLVMDNLGHMGTPSAIIEDVAVDLDWQRRGIGRQMMMYALNLCSERGCYKVVLSSNLKRDKAHAFYESLDFERHGYSYRVIIE